MYLKLAEYWWLGEDMGVTVQMDFSEFVIATS